MPDLFDFFAQPQQAVRPNSFLSETVAGRPFPKPNGHTLTVSDVLDHGPVTVTIEEMDAQGASGIVTRAGDSSLLGSSFRFEAKTPCIKRAPIHLLAKMRQRALVTLTCLPGRASAPVLTIEDVS